MGYDIPADHHSSGSRDEYLEGMSRCTTPAFAKGGAKSDAQGWTGNKCTCCKGTGDVGDDSPRGCPECGGTGDENIKHHAPTQYVDVVMSGFPDHEPPHFIEVENESGHSIKYGEWIKRPDGQSVLRINLLSRKETEHE